MNHQPYETWILEKGNLSKTEDAELQKHLASCPECASLHLALGMVEREIKIAPQISPAPGFTNRWLASLPARAKTDERTNVRNWLFALSASAFASLAAFIGVVSLSGSPVDLIVSGFQSFLRFFAVVSQAAGIFIDLISKLSPTVLAVGAIMLSSWILIVVLAWALSLRYASKQGVTLS